MNDYALSQQLLKHFPTLRGGQVEAAVQIAEHFKELRELLVTRKSVPKASGEDEKVGEEEEQFNKAVETSLQGLQTIPGEESTDSTDLLNSLWLSVANMYIFCHWFDHVRPDLTKHQYIDCIAEYALD